MNLKLGLVGTMLLGGVAFAAEGEGVKVGGFVDAQYNWAHKSDGSRNVNTFLLNDGALYFGKTMGMGEVLVDVPFSYDSSTNANIDLGITKAQAFVSWKYENGFNWKLGQFDSLYGFEANATADVIFSKQGLIYSYMPKVHTGLLLGYDLSDMLGVQFLVANPHDQGAMPDGAGNPDFGFKIGSKLDALKASVGGLFTRVGGQKGYIIDIMAGTKMAPWDFNLEVEFDKAAAVNASTRFGGGLNVGYALNEHLNLATRLEYTKLSTDKTFQWTVGPQWWMNKDLVVKLDYTFSNTTSSGPTIKGSAINLAAVQKF